MIPLLQNILKNIERIYRNESEEEKKHEEGEKKRKCEDKKSRSEKKNHENKDRKEKKNSEQKRKCEEEEKKQREIMFKDNLKNVKALAVEILSENSKKIKLALSFICNQQQIDPDVEQITQSSISKDQTIEWLIIFYWSLFLLNNISLDTIGKHNRFFKVFQSEYIIVHFNFICKAKYIRKYLIFDLLTQYFILDKPFTNEKLVFSTLLSTVTETSVFKFVDHCSKYTKAFQEIFLSSIIGKTIKRFKDIYNDAIIEFINYTYLFELPGSINGITLCNRTVIINMFSEEEKNYEEENVNVGFTLMTMLHELGHYLLRFKLDTDFKWFEKKSPERNGCEEGGSSFIKGIFGNEPEWITLSASKFILNVKNWNKKREEFLNEFNKANAPPPPELRNPTNYKRLKQQNIPGLISLIGCSRDRRRLERI